mmetsp:Transcript_84167/g.167978  ORF Transcript_84167/g.167978 Transcript_84167/m.167978 type:complete len:201 (+) Transcript_84167:92-694(+)
MVQWPPFPDLSDPHGRNECQALSAQHGSSHTRGRTCMRARHSLPRSLASSASLSSTARCASARARIASLSSRCLEGNFKGVAPLSALSAVEHHALHSLRRSFAAASLCIAASIAPSPTSIASSTVSGSNSIPSDPVSTRAAPPSPPLGRLDGFFLPAPIAGAPVTSPVRTSSRRATATARKQQESSAPVSNCSCSAIHRA